MNRLENAIVLASNAHKGQVDLQGEPYILHPLWVMMHLDDYNDKIAGVLHDVVEDTDITLDYLKEKLGLSESVIFAIDCLTKRKGENYDVYIKRVMSSAIAVCVKIQDIRHNLLPDRIKNSSNLKQRDLERIRKYIYTLNILKEC
jgi:(p)ppGpp synthase/HD superfamily hydrolase